MPRTGKIIIYEPDQQRVNGYFSVSIKTRLQKEPPFFQMPSRIFIISGIGHNFRSFIEILQDAGVINEKYRWAFGDGHLVILGHLSQSVECLWLIYALEARAARAGGYVHYIPEKEVHLLEIQWREVLPPYAFEKKRTNGTYTILYDGNNEIWRWLLTKNNMVRIGNLYFACSYDQIRPGTEAHSVTTNNLDKQSAIWIKFGEIKAYQGKQSV